MKSKKLIGELIEQKVRNQFTVTEFANKINCQRGNIYSIFRRKSIDIKLLKRISIVLNHNFFVDLANDMDLIENIENKEALNFEEKIISNFWNYVPDILEEMGKDSTIITTPLSEITEHPILPDYDILYCNISCTIGQTMVERLGKSKLMNIEQIKDSAGHIVEILTNRLNGTKFLNVPIMDYDENDWRSVLKLAFDTLTNHNIKSNDRLQQ